MAKQSVKPDVIEQHALKITAAWQQAVDSIIECGRLLIEAKQEVGHGNWGKVMNKLPFGDRVAQRLMKIAEHPVLSNPTHAAHLPASWTTLYELTNIEDDRLLECIESGDINPNMERKDAKALPGLHYEQLIGAFDKVIPMMRSLPPDEMVAKLAVMDGFHHVFDSYEPTLTGREAGVAYRTLWRLSSYIWDMAEALHQEQRQGEPLTLESVWKDLKGKPTEEPAEAIKQRDELIDDVCKLLMAEEEGLAAGRHARELLQHNRVSKGFATLRMSGEDNRDMPLYSPEELEQLIRQQDLNTAASIFSFIEQHPEQAGDRAERADALLAKHDMKRIDLKKLIDERARESA